MRLLTRNNRIIVSILALFSFVFLGTEYYFDNCVAAMVSAKMAVISQNVVLGASVIGFVLYGFIDKWRTHKERRFLVTGIGALCVLCMLGMFSLDSYPLVLCLGILCFITMGFAGSAACYLCTQEINDRKYLARICGFSYAIGILLQFLNNTFVQGRVAQTTVLCLASIAFAALFLYSHRVTAGQQTSQELSPAVSPAGSSVTTSVHRFATTSSVTSIGFSAAASTGFPVTAGQLPIGWILVGIVALMTCIFSTLDNAVTLVHASGDFDIGRWSTLILAASGIAAGFLYDQKDRKYMHVIMYAVTLLAAITIVVLTLGEAFLPGLLMFYCSAGFFVVYFMTTFMDYSYQSSRPRLWAGIGRAVNNLVAVLFCVVSVSILHVSKMGLMLMDLILLFLVSMAMLLLYMQSGKQLYEVTQDCEIKTNILNEVERIAAFADQYHLTEREKEVLEVLIHSEDNVQSIAATLNISRAALYRHLTSINEKTATKSRMGIIKKFYTEE